MKLFAVRDLNTQDPLPALGPKVEPPAPPPPPALRPTATPGIMQRPDGKLETDLPLPEAPLYFDRDWITQVTVSAEQAAGAYFSEACPRKHAPRCSYEDCWQRFTAHKEKGFTRPPLALHGVIYPIEAWQDGLLRCRSHDAVRLWRDDVTNSVVIPLAGKSGADYFP